MKKFLMMSLVALVAMTMTSCINIVNKKYRNDTPTQVSEVGKVTVMQPFDKVCVEGPLNIIYEQGDSNTVRVKASDELFEKMTIYVDNNELTVDLKEYSEGITKSVKEQFKGVQIFVTSTELKGITINGAGDVTVPNALDLSDINLNINGVGDINIAQMTCQNLDISISGVGDVTLGLVKADAVTARNTGVGDIDIAGLVCKTLNNETEGVGNMVFNNLNVDHVKSYASGVGNIALNGTVGSHEEKADGVGKVDTTGLVIKH